MSQEYGTEAANLKAVIGPSICQGCFQIGEEVATSFKDAGFPMDDIYCWNEARVEGDIKTGYHINF